LMGNDAERERLGSRAVEVTERFSLERVMGIWEDILGRVIEKRRA
jgi:GalNAc-alpha-(1->4)-GalNAc-alpha-(1->3)-diNAcBac-PP-undecaprenol alpha-1,4-N-acetyl-D-galactosaminyltransferase